MSVKIKLKHSSVVNKAPQPSDLDNGELALNTNAASPAAYIKDSNGNIVKLAGAGAIGGTDATTTAKGIVQLADAAAITAGTAGLVVDAAQLKAVSDADDWTRTGTTLAPKTAGDVVNISAGTAALPGLTPVGDPNTGVFSASADQIGIATNGTGRLLVDSAGKVGIGSPVPPYRLTVKDIADQIHITNPTAGDANNHGFTIGLTGADALLVNRETGSIIFFEGSVEVARLDASGRLLVGTSSALNASTAKLQCTTTVNITTTVYADNTAAKAGGLVAGDIYRKADGTLMITF